MSLTLYVNNFMTEENREKYLRNSNNENMSQNFILIIVSLKFKDTDKRYQPKE